MACEWARRRVGEGQQLACAVGGLEAAGVQGAPKLRRRIVAEIRSLEKKLDSGEDVKEEHVACSNLGQLEALTHAALRTPGVCGVLKGFLLGGSERLVVDVVADKGQRWIKVILRNPKALHLTYVTGGRGGVRPLNEVAQDYLMCASQNQAFYKDPKVEFWFVSGVSEGLAACLEGLGVVVDGQTIPDKELGLPDFTPPEDSDEDDDEDDDGDDDEFDDDEMSDDDSEEDSVDCSCDNGSVVNCEGDNTCEWSSESVKNIVKLTDAQTSLQNLILQDKNSESEQSSLRNVNLSPKSKCSICVEPQISQEGKEHGESDMQTTKTDKHIVESDKKLIDEEQQRTTINQQVQPNTHSPEEQTGADGLRLVNLDVTAMIAYVSATSNGQANFIFQDKFLSEQAEWERRSPVKPVLDGYFKGREVVVCREAAQHFQDIVGVIGGPGEQQRARELLARVRLVPGQDVLEGRVCLGGKVRRLARVIFGTGEALRAITVTSNKHFVRSIQNKGVVPVVLYHEPRALTEQKQDTATPL